MTEEQNILIDDLGLSILNFTNLGSIIGYNLGVFLKDKNEEKLKILLKEKNISCNSYRGEDDNYLMFETSNNDGSVTAVIRKNVWKFELDGFNYLRFSFNKETHPNNILSEVFFNNNILIEDKYKWNEMSINDARKLLESFKQFISAFRGIQKQFKIFKSNINPLPLQQKTQEVYRKRFGKESYQH